MPASMASDDDRNLLGRGDVVSRSVFQRLLQAELCKEVVEPGAQGEPSAHGGKFYAFTVLAGR